MKGLSKGRYDETFAGEDVIFFDVGIPNLVCICILGWGIVTYHFRVFVTLTFDLVLMIIVSGEYRLYYLR